MQTSLHAILSALGLSGVLLLSGAPRTAAIELAFAPEEGLVLEKHATSEATLDLLEAEFEMNGESIDVEVPEITQGSASELALTDRYGTTEAGRLVRLERTFDALERYRTIEGTPDGEGDMDETLKSPLVGAKVVFTWDAEDDEYEAAYADDSAEGYDEDLLDELDWDVDYADLLPGEAVEEGDSWTVNAEAMGVVISLGGELHFDEEEDSPEEALIQEALEENLEGDATLTFTGLRDHEGIEVAVVRIEWEAEGTAEDDDTVGGDGEAMADVHRMASAEVTLEGELLWDAKGGHFVLLDLSGRLSLTIEGTVTAREAAFERRSSVTYAGTVSVRVTAAAP